MKRVLSIVIYIYFKHSWVSAPSVIIREHQEHTGIANINSISNCYCILKLTYIHLLLPRMPLCGLN